MDKNYNYKWTKGFGIAILITLVLIVGAAFAQTSPNTPSGYSIDGQTGNLIPNGALTSSTGWSSSSGSPGWVPNASPLGSFGADGYTFSYQMEELGKSGINLGGFNLGYTNTSAIFVTGFSYGLQYRFPCANQIGGNCTDPNGLQDNLRVEVGYYPALGAPTFYTHQLGLKNINDGNPAYNPNWQTLAETVTFAGAKTLAQAGSVNMGIVGQDAGFWACLGQECYGPQVKNAYVKANYSVDPCILNPAFNPSCPGFQNILQGSKSPTFYYSYNIAQSLPHIGGGVVLHGYDYGFNWYNYGACYNTFMFWCTDWRTDGGGNINFRISDKNNTTMLQQQWYVSGNNNAGSFSSRHLFTESKNSLDMGNVQWWASDVWNHFGWVGWTRPIWTPDPCYTNGLYSPNCSNFQQTLTQVVADIKAQQEKIAALNPSSTSLTPSGSITVTLNDVNSTNPSVTITTVNDPSQQSNRPNNNQNNQSLVATEIPAIVTRNASQNARVLSLAQRAIAEANQTASSSMKEAESIASNNVQASIASSINTQGSEQPIQSFAQVNRNDQNNNSPITLQQNVPQKQQNVVDHQVMQQEQVITDNILTRIELVQPIQQSKQQEQIVTDNIIVTIESTLPMQQPKQQEQTAIDSATQIITQNIPESFQQPKQQEQIVADSTTQIITQNIPESFQQPKQQEQIVTIATPITIESAAQILMPNAMFKSTEMVVIVPTLPPVNSTRVQEEKQEKLISNDKESQQVYVQPVAVPEIQQAYAPPSITTLSLQSPTTVIESPVQALSQPISPIAVTEAEQPQQQRNFTTDKTNPINDIIENKQIIAEQKIEQSNISSVNRNVQNNEAAGSVGIESIATQPPGFNQYASLVLRDAAFYAPKEIYRGQKTVDNARALRQLASDRLHQEMVNQQYLPR
jgi:hypothetical protein